MCLSLIHILENRAVAGVNIEEFSRSDHKRPLDPLDSSITFHVCHSPQREVEVLHDRLPVSYTHLKLYFEVVR